MAHVVVVERDLMLGERSGATSIQEALESAGHTVTVLPTTAGVIPFLRSAGERVDVVALAMLQRDSSMRSFDVVKEMCRIPELRELGKILVFPMMADPREQEQMYGARGYASFEPQLHRTVAVNEQNLLALEEAISVVQGS
jgi:hypothetical protein